MTKYSKAIEAIIGKTRATGDHAKRMLAVQHKIFAATQALENLAATKDPTLTNQAHILRTAKAADQLRATIARQNEVLDDLRMNASIDLHGKQERKANLKPDPQYADAILRRFQPMKPANQAGLIGDLMSMGDGPSLAAILNAPSAASGIEPDLRNRYRDDFLKSAAPDESAEIAEMLDADSATAAVFKAATRSATELSDPRVVSEILGQQESAQRASGAFEAATGPQPLH